MSGRSALTPHNQSLGQLWNADAFYLRDLFYPELVVELEQKILKVICIAEVYQQLAYCFEMLGLLSVHPTKGHLYTAIYQNASTAYLQSSANPLTIPLVPPAGVARSSHGIRFN